MPALQAFGAILYDRLSPLAQPDPENDYALAKLCGAVGAMKDETHALVSDSEQGSGWSALLDVDRCPARFLPFLAQIVGERIPAGETAEASRNRIRFPQGPKRGTVGALEAAAKRTLAGSQFVLVLERTSSAYTLTVVTLTSETPDPTATNRDLQAAKPIGLVLTHVVTNVTIIDALAGTIDSLAGTIDAL
jgi:hypothetical protein